MAARENQGFLIAVIILVLLTLVLALTTFLGISKANEYAATKAAAEKSLAVQKTLSEAHKIEAQVLRAYVGDLGPSVAEVQSMFDSLDKLSLTQGLTDSQKAAINDVMKGLREVRTEYENDMKMFIASDQADEDAATAEEQTWRSLVRNLNHVLANKHNETNVLRNELARIEREAKAEIAAKQKTVEETEALLVKVRDDLASEKNRNAQKERELTDALEAIRQQHDVAVRQLEDVTQRFTDEVKVLKNDIAVLDQEKAVLKAKIDVYERENFDLPDGRIVRVAHRIDRVFIDLGFDDGLRSNLSFAVYDQTVTDFEKGKHKAMIEVTRVLGAHEAEARITKEDPLNPILSKDFILTATWDPGYYVPIALIGFFDLDGDGSSDRLQLVQMIENNGGRVVAMIDEDGNVIGEIDATTRYAVLGEAPEPGPETSASFYDAIRTLEEQAKKNTVQRIDLRKLMNWMGRHNRADIQRLDSRIGEEFRRRESRNFLKADDR